MIVPDYVTSRSRKIRSVWPMALIVLALVVLTFAAFGPGLDGEFLNWDDDRNFVENPSYRGLGLDQLRWAWHTYHLGVWQPLSWALLGGQYEIGGMDPLVYRSAGLMLHAVNAVVFYALAVVMLGAAASGASSTPRWGVHFAAAAAAMLFATHPLRVEVVSWTSCQPYLPATLFYMLAVLVYVRGYRRAATPAQWRAWLAIVFVCYVLAVASKAVAVSLPAVLLILDVWPLGRWRRRAGRPKVANSSHVLGVRPGRTSVAQASRLCPPVAQASRLCLHRRDGGATRLLGHVLIEKLPMIAVAVLISVWAAAAKDFSESRVPLGAFDADARLAQCAYGLVFYLEKTLAPVDLIPYYRLPENLGLGLWRCGLAAMVVGIVTVGLILARRRWPAALAAWAAYVVILLPNLGLVEISQQIATDRYSYLAMLPLMLLLAGALLHLWRRDWSHTVAVRCTLAAGIMAATAGLTAMSRQQSLIWRDSVSLWTATLSVDPQCAVAECQLGHALVIAGRQNEAASRFQAAIDLKPNFSFAHSNLGAILYSQGRFSEAVESFEHALAAGPDLSRRDRAKTHAGLGAAYAGLGRYAAAWTHTRQAQHLGLEAAQKMIDYLRTVSPEPTDRGP